MTSPEGMLIARVVTAMKMAVSWFLLAIVFHAWDKDKLDQTGARWGRYSRAIWSGEAAGRAENQVPETLFLLIETNRTIRMP